MADFAVIVDGVVSNIVVSEPEYAAQQGWIEATPDAAIGGTYADGVFGPAPTIAAPVPMGISDRQFFQQLFYQGQVSQDESEAAVASGVIPPAMLTLISQLPAEMQYPARMLVKGATTFERHNSVAQLMSSLYGWTSDQTDQFWREASLL